MRAPGPSIDRGPLRAQAILAGVRDRVRRTRQDADGSSEGWSGVLDRLGVSVEERLRIAVRARANGTSFRTELAACDLVDEAGLRNAFAAELGLATVDRVDPEQLVMSDADCLALLRRRTGSHPAMIRGLDGDTAIVLSSDRMDMRTVARTLARAPHLRGRLRAASGTATRRALIERASPLLAAQAVHGLSMRFPDLSARIVASAWQGFVLGAAVVGIPLMFALWMNLALATLHAVSSFFFLACVGLRFAAMKSATPPRLEPLVPVPADRLPTYSVLVALYKEAEIVPDLIAAMERLLWPASKLEIKLVCEAGDRDTLDAIRACHLKPHFEVIEVPDAGPRTKPKALSYALPTVSGEFVVLYDAEDRPDPAQLMEAHQAFAREGPDLACLQAPLDITNGGRNAICRLFAFEYSALFKGMLPFLSANGFLLPLGGTSNHFRRSILEEVGAWDPYNVTEDADLGVRLARFGYRTATITRPTLEEAPVDLKTWLPQRTRWLKGWFQTWLVHMRYPRQLYQELGPASFFVAQILFLGMVASALVHPFLVIALFWFLAKLAAGASLSTGQSLLLLVDVANVVCGYVSFLLLGWQTLEPPARKSFWKVVAMTPVYWMMMSAAAWRAAWQLWRNPHLWEKTHHPRMAATVASA
jgi:cellulose synthase/poly-beta-1,6-N-acetylglucosamine synthase-like glycosyltransferase